MWVDELAMMVDLAGKIGVTLVRRLEDNLGGSQYDITDCVIVTRPVGAGATCLGAVCEFMGSQVNLSKGAFPNQAPKTVVAHRLKILV